MAGKRTIESLIAQLRADCSDPRSEPARAALLAALADKRSLLVTAAAGLIEKHELPGFEPALSGAFARFLEQAEKTDKGCFAKAALARALDRLDADGDAVFGPGIRHRQLEPVWGGRQDTAVELRVTCAVALARRRRPEVMFELARLLADPEVMARAGAATAIGHGGDPDGGAALLRFKALTGDADARVTAAALSGLLALDRERSVDFVAEFLDGDDDALFEAAALALGESRASAAFAPLRRACEQASAARRKIAMLATALLRSEPAWDYLLAQAAEQPLATAQHALEALSVFARDPALREGVQRALAKRGDRELEQLASRLFAADVSRDP